MLSIQGSGLIAEKGVERLQEPEVANEYKGTVSFGYNSTMHIGTHSTYDNMPKPHASSCMTDSQHREGGRHVLLPLTEKLLAADNCCEKYTQFSLRMLPFIGQTHPTPMNIRAAQIRLPS